MEIRDLFNQQSDFFNSNKTKNVSFRIEQLKNLKTF